MKINRIIKILMIALIGISIGSTVSNAAIEIKSQADIHIIGNINTAYSYCYNMRAYSSSLGANSLDPHLALSADWGAAVYLGASGYGGIDSKGGNSQYKYQISNIYNYISTTPNMTGVMNYTSQLGSNAGVFRNFFVSTMIFAPECTYNLDDMKADQNNTVALNSSSKYVELLTDITKSNGLALSETRGWFTDNSQTTMENPYIARSAGTQFSFFSGNGIAGQYIWYTYRPVIWN